MRRNFVIIFSMLVLASSLVLSAACTSTRATDIPGKPAVNDQVNTISSSAYSSTGKPDRVELVYFHTKNPCHCMAVVGDNIKYAVDTYFKDEQSSGKVKLMMIVSDDPANASLVKQYDAMLFTLFVKEIRGKQENIYPISRIWEMTGDDNRDKLVNYMKTLLNNALEGKNS
jgi:hypothetical protein